MTEYFKRDITPVIAEALKGMPVVVITGMRQTGKSTFLQRQMEFRNRQYITLDDFAQLEAVKENPEGIVDKDEPVTIDEVQKCPELLTVIKKSVDRNRLPGRFLLSGSANLAMLKGISESLAGRAVYFTMHPFTRREIEKKVDEEPFLYRFFKSLQIKGVKDIKPITWEDVLQGGMPPVCLGEAKNRFIWFKGYEQTYLERDLRELSQIGNIISFRHLMRLTALRSGQLLSMSQLGRDAKMNTATTSRYLSLLEASFIIYRIKPYLRSMASRLIKSPKIYLSDSGIACYLAGIREIEEDPLRGAMFETYIAQNIMGIITARWPEAEMYFWNVQGRHEVDFVIEEGRKCLAIEVKASERWQDRDLAGLKAFLSSTPHCSAAILAYNGTRAVNLGGKIWAIPASLLLS